MLEKLEMRRKDIYPIIVVSTMSSGKSTLINALLGEELLPSRNRACTAKAIAILNNEVSSNFKLHTVDKEGKCCTIDKVTKKMVTACNEADDIQEMILEGKINGIHHGEKSFAVLDTPGVNNSMEQLHEAVTKKALTNYQEGVILYVLNAQQIGTYDDRQFLARVSRLMHDHPKFRIIFAINKIDLIDPARESLEEVIANCKDYIADNGIEQPIIIPISAGSALVFKKVLSGRTLSEMEEENFVRNYKYFRRRAHDQSNHGDPSNLEGALDVINIEGVDYTRTQIHKALENTGLSSLVSKLNELIS